MRSRIPLFRIPLIAFFSLFTGILPSFAADVDVGENATVQIPQGWKVGEASSVEFVASNVQDTMSIVFLRETGTEIEISSVEEYYEAKLINLDASLKDFKAEEKKAGEINGLKAAFTVATAKMMQEGKELDSKMYLMMYDGGNGDYYMAMIATSPRLFDANSKDFMKMLRSFRMK